MNYSNLSSNFSVDTNCELSQEFDSIYDFLRCYKYFAIESLEITIYCIIVIFGGLILNILAMYLLSTKTSHITVFDKIFISHAFVDLLTGVVDFPFMYFISIFHYWPFSKTFCIYYVAFDNILATVEVLHIVFMSWARIRCILSPTNYSNQLILKHPYLFILLLWVLCSLLWIPVTYVFINRNYEENVCELSFDSIYVSILIICIGWIIPVIITMLSTAYIVYVLMVQNRKKKKLTSNKTDLSLKSSSSLHDAKWYSSKRLMKITLNPQTKLSIIITPFCLQYLQYSLVWLVSTICSECVSSQFYVFSYFIAFLTSFSNPLILLIFNSSFFCKNKLIK